MSVLLNEIQLLVPKQYSTLTIFLYGDQDGAELLRLI